MELVSTILLSILFLSAFILYMMFSILLISDIISSILFIFRKKPLFHDVIWFRSIVDNGIVIRGYGVVNQVSEQGFIIKYRNSDGSFGVVNISNEKMRKLIELKKIDIRFKISRPHIYFKLN